MTTPKHFSSRHTNRGMYRVALKMLFRDRTRYLVLLGAFFFSTLLITQQAGIFCGLLSWSTATIRNLRVPIWVMDPNVAQVDESKPLKATDVDRIRSIDGVDWAVPLRAELAQVKLSSGDFQYIRLIGLDDTTLIGRPSQMIEGNIEDLRLPDSILVDDLAVKRFGIKMSDTLELNDHTAHVVGIFKGERSFTGVPYIITTFTKASRFTPPVRKQTSYVLASPKPSVSALELTRQIQRETGLKAYTEDQFFWVTVNWVIKNTGIPFAFGTTVVLGIVVGIAVSAQTFYAFVMDHLRHLATFKAMGVSTALLGKMLLLQSLTAGLLGFGAGSGLGAIFGWMSFKNQEPPFLIPYQLLLFTFTVTILICLSICYLGWRKVKTIEAGVVFR